MTTPTNPLTAARHRDVERRRGRVQQALTDMQREGSDINLSAVANRAHVHRSFLHRHPDLHAQIVAAAEQPNPAPLAGTVSRRTLDADNLNLRETVRRQAQHIADLESRLSELLGDQAYIRSGLGAPHDHNALQQQILTLQAEVQQLRAALDERTDELDAARLAHRQLMNQVNRHPDSARRDTHT